MKQNGIEWLHLANSFMINRLTQAEVSFRMAKTPREALRAATEWLDAESRYNEINNLLSKIYEDTP